MIPTLDLSLTVPLTTRYQVQNTSAASTACTFTFQNLAWACTMATSTTNLQPVFDAIRLKRVTVWGASPGSAAGALAPSATVSFLWGNLVAQVFPFKPLTDTVLGTAHNLYLCAKPPKDSLLSEWTSVANTATAFIVTAPPGAIIQVEIVGRTDRSGVSGAAILPSTPAVLGTIYSFDFAPASFLTVGGVSSIS